MTASHPVISAEFSQSNVAEIGPNIMRVAGKGHHPGCQKSRCSCLLRKVPGGSPLRPTQDVSPALRLLLTPNLSRHHGAGLPQWLPPSSPCTLLRPLQTAAKIMVLKCKSFKRLKTLPCLPLSHRIKSNSLWWPGRSPETGYPLLGCTLSHSPSLSTFWSQGPSPLLQMHQVSFCLMVSAFTVSPA